MAVVNSKDTEKSSRNKLHWSSCLVYLTSTLNLFSSSWKSSPFVLSVYTLQKVSLLPHSELYLCTGRLQQWFLEPSLLQAEQVSSLRLPLQEMCSLWLSSGLTLTAVSLFRWGFKNWMQFWKSPLALEPHSSIVVFSSTYFHVLSSLKPFIVTEIYVSLRGKKAKWGKWIHSLNAVITNSPLTQTNKQRNNNNNKKHPQLSLDIV